MGLFVAIEGGDGSGKGTQSTLLADYLTSQKKDVLKISFPRYGEPSAYYAGNYLDGAYGAADTVPADLASLAYAVDRYAASKDINAQLEKKDGVVIADRYVASNLAHQGTKFSDTAERHAYYERMKQTEYEVLGIPRPSVNIVLIMPTDLAQANVDKKDAQTRSYTTKKRDIHEADASHLERAKANYEELCRLYPDEFIAIQCVDQSNVMRPIDDIQTEIQSIIKSL